PNRNRRILRAEILDLLLVVALKQLEVVPFKINHRMILGVSYRDRDQNHFHIYTKANLRSRNRIAFRTLGSFARHDVDVLTRLRPGTQRSQKCDEEHVATPTSMCAFARAKLGEP